MPRQPERAGASAASRAEGASLARRAAALSAAHAGLDARAIAAAVLRDKVAGEAALVSSFGADSIVLLHMCAEIDPAVPVVFIDTGRLFPETLAYRDRIVDALGLADVRTVGPATEVEAERDPMGALFAVDADACCGFRKVEPLARALAPFDAWITGRKRAQAATRSDIPLFEADATHIKVNPLATWQPADVLAYVRDHGLPPHPLVARGYPSIGCAPCTSPVAPGEDPRAGRWRGQGKTECGIHVAGAAQREAR